MKILIAAGIYPPDAGGPAIHAEAQFKGFPRLGVETELVALAHFRKWPFGLRHALYLKALFNKVASCDVVLAHDALGVGWPALIATKLSGKKFVLRVGGDVVWERQAEKDSLSMLEWYEQGKHRATASFYLARYVLRHADLVIVPSTLLTRLYTKHYDVASGRIEVVTNPLPAKMPSTSSTERTLLFASRLVAYKNLEFVLRALVPFFLTDPKLTFMIIGEGPERRHLEKLSEDLKIVKRVVFKGSLSQPEVMKETASSWLVLAPALTEFNPNYVLQALACGKPFLISRENGLPFDIPSELVFDPCDEESFRAKLAHLLTERGYLMAKQFVGSLPFTMTWEDNLRENVRLIGSLLDGSK